MRLARDGLYVLSQSDWVVYCVCKAMRALISNIAMTLLSVAGVRSKWHS